MGHTCSHPFSDWVQTGDRRGCTVACCVFCRVLCSCCPVTTLNGGGLPLNCGGLPQCTRALKCLPSSLVSSVVCEIGPLDPLSTNWGPVEVELEGGKRGTSSVFFTYRVANLPHVFTSITLLHFWMGGRTHELFT